MLLPSQWARILSGVILATVMFLFWILESRGYYPHAIPTVWGEHSTTAAAESASSAQQTRTFPQHSKSTAIADIYPLQSHLASSSSHAHLRKAIVVGKTSSGSTEWIGRELADWESSIYVVDLPEGVESPTGLRTKTNKANEATPYLTYIIDHYHDLPDVTAFVHSNSISWHNDAPYWNVANSLLWLNPSIVQQRGFVNLRCVGHPGCPNEIQLNRSPIDETLTVELAYPVVFGEFFNMTVEDVKKNFPTIAAPCCAQFALSRAQILQRPKEEYERWLRLIHDSDLASHVLGTVLEYMWHIIFGQDAVHCEPERECRAALYGWGDPSEWPEATLPSNFVFGAVGPPGPSRV